MKCPVCVVELKIYVRQGIEIDYCPQCRGVWLDRGELDKIIEAAQDDYQAPRGPAPVAGQTVGQIPQPATPLPQTPLSQTPMPPAPAPRPGGYNQGQQPYGQPHGHNPHGDYRSAPRRDYDDDDDDDDDRRRYGNDSRYGGDHRYGNDPRYGKHRKKRGLLGELFDVFD